ncbi:MAG: succinate dehydrogenase/fumarate reductase cytochrome b subunit [bacterium]|uniref:Succinate dehydrogenase/fumarate reductase cytochrome b subunit n=1 Tax=Candidatus Aphodosoma intestinipullorum TaxID=2840674 RepID=A0A940DKH8_9BACT|nr:succinate dehydrogenase/fumarate reductase cytochrome b subunit [Candidatus Aphodosoma intestinipullorum]
MTWLSNSSVGRKVVMSVTGAALVLFLLFHATMNVVAIFSGDAYNAICKFLGANWYALVGTLGLGFLVVVHIIYAFILSVQNYRARGKERYAVTDRQKDVEWASKNMLVLGIIVVCFIFLHLYNFWAKMQLVELQHMAGCAVNTSLAQNGVYHIQQLFSSPVYSIVYLVWLAALWFHLTHGIWSAMHTLGWNNNIWMARWKCIAKIVATLIVLMFAAVVVCFAFGIAPICA